MNKTTYKVKKMDCPCEENLIRMKLEGYPFVKRLEFDLSNRLVYIFHEGHDHMLEDALHSLALDSLRIDSTIEKRDIWTEDNTHQRDVLRKVLFINFAFFVLEMAFGILSKSMGLVADSLDMLADALVYGMSLMVVGAALERKKKVALGSGIIQIALAIFGLIEIIKRFIGIEVMPDFRSMIGISFLALLANSYCLWLLHRSESRDVHMQASLIFSANDVIINIGVISAGLFVWLFKSNIPDLVIGIIVFLIVIKGAFRIIGLSK